MRRSGDLASVLATAFFMMLAPYSSTQAQETDEARAVCAERVATDQGIDPGQVTVESAGLSQIEDSIEVRGRFRRAAGGEMMFHCFVGMRGDLAGQIVTLNYL